MADDTQFLLWLLLLSSPTLSFASELDVQCLKSVQKSVIDPNGILRSSWNFSGDGSRRRYICEFTGVECWSSLDDRVLSLRLRDFGLHGPFPQGLHDCASMSGLDLSGNNFTGPIPSDIGLQMPYLASLDLSDNSFSGEIPDSIANMIYLNAINLEHNQLSGQIPGRFNVLGRLNTFTVAGNLLSGPIPAFRQKFPASEFAGNQGLCGSPLDDCSASRKRMGWVRIRINDQSSIGAAIGFVAGFVVAFYFHCFVFAKRFRVYLPRTIHLF